VTVSNRGPEEAELHLLPTLWFRNTWSWGRTSEEHGPEPVMRAAGASQVVAEHNQLGTYELSVEPGPAIGPPEWLFTDNETNVARVFGGEGTRRFVKDAFHERVVLGRSAAVNPARSGTKAAAWFRLKLAAGASAKLDLRLAAAGELPATPFGRAFDDVLRARRAEADEFYAQRIPPGVTAEERSVARQAYAGLLWTKQFYHYVVQHWLEGDPGYPPPPVERKSGRNADWLHLYNRDVVSMPDKWEYPWYAAWDLAFHMLPFARIDTAFAKGQLELFLREWYMHPNGQIPAYEWALSDVNPPVHAWAAWRVYKKSGKHGARDVAFLKRVFHKLLLNFNWWVNRKDRSGKHVFAGGFLGLDNIGVFDRSAVLPSGGYLDQADGTAWMAFFCGTMLSIALELALHDAAYEDLASKFFEHYVAIVDAMNTLGGTGLWDEQDGFYYDELHIGEHTLPLRVRSLVGLIPLIAVEIIERRDDRASARLPEAHAVVPGEPLRPRAAHRLARGAQLPPAPAALDPLAPAPRARARVPPRREGVPLAARHPLALARSRGNAVRPAPRGPRVARGLRPGRRRHRPLRRQLELAWTGLVPDQLPADRGARALRTLLRGRARGRVPDRLGPPDEPGRGRARARAAARQSLPARVRRIAAVPWRRAALPRRPALEGPRAVPRVLPCRDGPRPRREPPDRLDGAGSHAARGFGGRARRERGARAAGAVGLRA
jgi:hypothetical protein